jgi:hypothetical protein
MNTLRKELDRHRSHVFCAFSEDARWNAERQAVEFGVEIGKYRTLLRSGGASSTVAPGAAHARAMCRGVLSPANAVREHR